MLYTYLAAHPLPRGTFVRVPFGSKDAEREAVVWDAEPESRPESETKSEPGAGAGAARPYKLKQLLRVMDVPPLCDWELRLCRSLQARYVCTFGAAVRCVRPYRGDGSGPGRLQVFAVSVRDAAEVRAELAGNRFRNIRQIRVLELLLDCGGQASAEELQRGASCSRGVLQTLAKNGYLRLEKRRVDPLAGSTALPGRAEAMPTYAAHPLNEEQQTAFRAVSESLRTGEPAVYLLHGVTGSGKTELYMQLIALVRAQGGNAVLLVPEISLTPQMVSHFTARFGNDVAVLHSRLTDAQRMREWKRVADGAAHIAVGARSAVFAPFSHIELIVVDEAHDASYCAEEGEPRYRAGEVAEMRLERHGTVLYGTATPDVAMYRRARYGDGSMRYLRLEHRAGAGQLPQVIVSDLRDEPIRDAGGVLFGRELLSRMRDNYAKGLQTLLFVGRRGYASTVLCRECGRTMECGKCRLPMTYYASSGRLICHYCGNTVLLPPTCPACGSRYLDRRGIGTERVAEELQTLFPGATVLRMDTDTTSGRDGHARILRAFAKGDVPFLVGTQMVVKGHDFPRVTLVGVVRADALFSLPEYRASERAYQLLAQVAGRAGRGDAPGTVVIQAYDVDNYAISAVRNHDYTEFYRNEIALRERLWYPPFCSMGRLQLACKQDREGYTYFRDVAQRLRAQSTQASVYGPSRAPVPKANGLYRWQIFIKAPNREAVEALIRFWCDREKPHRGMRVTYMIE